MAFAWIIFNPFSMIGGFTNLGSLNDAIFYLVAIWPLLDEKSFRNPVIFAIINTMATYFDPRIIFLVMPLSVMQSRYHLGHSNRQSINTLKETMTRLAVTYALIILMFFLMSKTEL